MEKLWSRREVIRREKIYTIDEYLDFEERRVGYKLLERAREIEDRLRKVLKSECNIVRENTKIKINGVSFIWNKEIEDIVE